jgi:glycosyltransferase involved in cell wall biosynthesis
LGDGPLRHDVERLAQEIAPGAVSIAGFVNQSLIGKWYTAADILVLPSLYRETWGLVVNEAMNFALPAVTSDHVGCAPDLIIEGVTGATFTAGSTSSLHDCLRTLLKGHSLAAMGEAARRHIAHWDVSSSAASIARAAPGLRNAFMSTSASRVT